MDDLDVIDKMLEQGAKNSILQEMGIQNVNNYLVLDDRQEEARRLAANATPKKFSEMVDKLSETFTGGLSDAATLLGITCNNIITFKTAIPDLDAILQGGIYNTKITEITGLSGSGKTKFCYKLVLTILARTSERILYIDSGCSFSFDRLEYYCNKFRMTKSSKEKEILYSRVRHVTASTPKELLFVLLSLLDNLEKGKIQLGFVIIDSFSSILNMNAELGDYEEHLTEIYRLMKMLNSNFVGVLVTTIAKVPSTKAQKPKSILMTPWNFMPQVSLLIENMATEAMKSDTQKTFYKLTLLASEYSDDLPTVVVPLNMYPSKTDSATA